MKLHKQIQIRKTKGLEIAKTALPLSTIETDFAIDSSGFRTTCFNAYCKDTHNTKQSHEWVKAHVCIGTKTNVITNVVIGDEHSANSPQFIPIVKDTHDKGFAMREVSADKAYISRDNLDAVADLGGMAYVPFKVNASQHGYGGRVWNKMYYYFKLCNGEFIERYHKRSNVEKTFSAIKKKLGETLKSKNRTAQINELLCKIIAYNLTILIQEIHELDSNPNFVMGVYMVRYLILNIYNKVTKCVGNAIQNSQLFLSDIIRFTVLIVSGGFA